jgi:hypothetical protein
MMHLWHPARKHKPTPTPHTSSPRLLASTKLNSSAKRRSSSISSSVDDDTLRCCCGWNRTGGEILDGPAPAPAHAFLGAEPLALPALDPEAFSGILHADDRGSDPGLPPPGVGVGDTDVGGGGVAAACARPAETLPVGLASAPAIGGKKWSSICILVPAAAASSSSPWPASIGSSRYGGEIWIFWFEADGTTLGIGRPAFVVVIPERCDETDTDADADEPDEEDDEPGGAARELAVLAVVLGRRLLPPLAVLRSSASESTKSSKSPSKTPSSASSEAVAAASRFAWLASSRLSIRMYSTASASLRPRFSSPARCSRSRPYARLECSASSLSRPYDSWMVLCNST